MKKKKSLDTETVSKEIIAIRSRLAEIDQEREALPNDAFAARTDLLDEEHHLQARLAELRDTFGLAEDTRELVVDPRKSAQQPNL